MNSHFIDTNLFLRYITNDVPDQAELVDQLLLRAEQGDFELHTSVLTIAEMVWTLESYYGLEPEAVRDQIVAILNTPGLKVENAEILAHALSLYVNENIDFVDAYNGIWMQKGGIASAITFDIRHFQRIPGITVQTPGDLKG
jgi:predicted nucleic-acid-binding protein